ncbi:MAG TPA: DUF169 domain-containing protein [bacterium]|nr:DUF169 domain-containing protein [bacterium]
MSEPATTPSTAGYDFPAIVEELNRYLRLRSIPIGMKRLKTRAEMEAIPKIRRPAEKMVFDQVVGQARLLGWTVGVTADDFAGPQCARPIGLAPRSEDWLSGQHMINVWYGTGPDAAAHQEAMDCAPHGDYEAVVVSPLVSGRLPDPDICLIYGTPGQMILFINGLQYTGYKKLEFTVVGESACADSWGKALSTGEPSLSIPCYAERRFGGVADDEMLIALAPSYLPKILEGLASLSRNGFRYPISPWGVQNSPAASLAVSYPDRKS